MGRVSAAVKTVLSCGGRPPKPDPVADAMSSQIVLHRPSKALHRKKLTRKESSTVAATTHSAATSPTPSMIAQLAEVAGGTTAECAAVCCCCPCGIINLVVLVAFRLPAALGRKAIKRLIRKKKVCILQQQQQSPRRHGDDSNWGMEFVVPGEKWPDKSPSAVVSEMEREMLTKLYGTGFWRSPTEPEL